MAEIGTGFWSHASTMLARYGRKVLGKYHLSTIISDGTTDLVINPDGSINVKDVPPTTSTIANITLDNNEWTQIGGMLSDIRFWRLSEKKGYNIEYAFTATPGDNFSIAYGSIEQKTAPTAIYVRRQTDSQHLVKLETWS